MSRKKKVVLSILAFIFALCAVVAYAVNSAYQNNIKKTDFDPIFGTGVKEDESNKDRINVLVLGMEHTRTDTIMVATFDPKEKTLNVISIPRDTYVERDYPDYYPYNTYKKINAMYELPTQEGGIERLAAKVSEILGIPIHDYIMVNYDAVADVTDAVGGIDVDIPFPMYYDDPWSDPPLHIYFEKGIAHLDGQNAIEYLRWRHNNDGSYSNEGDGGRVKRQQGFLKKLLEKALNPTVFPKLVDAAFKNVETSLELSTVMGLVSDVTSMPKENIRFYQEVGTPAYFNGLWYYLLDEDKTLALMQKIMNNEEITDDDINVSPEFEQEALAKDNSSSYNSKSSGYQEYQYTPTNTRKKVEDTKLTDTTIFETETENKDDETINNSVTDPTKQQPTDGTGNQPPIDPALNTNDPNQGTNNPSQGTGDPNNGGTTNPTNPPTDGTGTTQPPVDNTGTGTPVIPSNPTIPVDNGGNNGGGTDNGGGTTDPTTPPPDGETPIFN